MPKTFLKYWPVFIAAIGIAWACFLAWTIYRIVVWLTA